MASETEISGHSEAPPCTAQPERNQSSAESFQFEHRPMNSPVSEFAKPSDMHVIPYRAGSGSSTASTETLCVNNEDASAGETTCFDCTFFAADGGLELEDNIDNETVSSFDSDLEDWERPAAGSPSMEEGKSCLVAETKDPVRPPQPKQFPKTVHFYELVEVYETYSQEEYQRSSDSQGWYFSDSGSDSDDDAGTEEDLEGAILPPCPSPTHSELMTQPQSDFTAMLSQKAQLPDLRSFW